MVITFDTSNAAVAAYEQLKGRVYEDKKLLGNIVLFLSFVTFIDFRHTNTRHDNT